MNASWIISSDTLAKAEELLETNRHKELVIRRREKNLTRKEVDISKQAIWEVMVGCQVTTQQRSGPETKVGIFMNELNPTRSPALSYKTCRDHAITRSRDHASPQQFIESELRAAQQSNFGTSMPVWLTPPATVGSPFHSLGVIVLPSCKP